ncbi:hypothetical protein PAAG_04047 [Paracoccidioides lutzii Pb01]|uniref:EKC/KEOPS complex subunit BUD32 n=1 Tax=Paracoccidioides lutzii (strain ATCC MYA-826 / Pb01) TaxID=502779 RepID=C1GZV3_PARBA|nr:hypothetical protein PAAG_04047 [Paracoccidioides lutzii Pb01]EEH32994.2 hypothetical protein PAAG_04047 [Paracoccidioides lutzii Pb01]
MIYFMRQNKYIMPPLTLGAGFAKRQYRNLLTVLLGEEIALDLRSGISNRNVASELVDILGRARKGDFNYSHYQPLVRLVIQKEPDVDIGKAVLNLITTVSRATPPANIPPPSMGTPVKSTSSSQNGSEQTRELANLRIFEEICGCTFHDVDGFFDKYFEGKNWSDEADAICQRMLSPDSNEQHPQLVASSSRRPTYSHNHAAPTSPLDILVVGELKKSNKEIRTKDTLLQMSCYVREVFAAQPTRRFIHAFAVCGTKMEPWVFDRSGPYSSGIIDVYQDSRRFFQVFVRYTMMSDEQLGLDTFIARDEDGSKSITLKGPGTLDEKVLQLGGILSFQRAIVCRGTTCFLTNDGQGVAKFSWVSDKQRPEVELLELAGQKNVQGVATIIGHSTITSIADMRCGLTFNDKHHNFKSAAPSTPSSFHQSQPVIEPLGAQAKPFRHEWRGTVRNRVLRCLVISPAGRPIYSYESPLELLMALRDAIKAHQCLYLDGNILHRDISENNIIITDPDKAGGHSGMLIDLDLAKDVGSGRSGARHWTGTMEFMAIEVLLNIDHTYRHDLESFFYMLIWQCAHHGLELKTPQTSHQLQERPESSLLKKWYTGNYEEIATYK